MTDHPHTITCPNCGFDAEGNFCAECGQPTHLHKESFLNLVLHFFEHYFHYDSKFWRTLKALLFKPGALTLAYWNRQRMKYIPPISLYIFVSAVYFIAANAFLSLKVDSVERMMEKYKNLAINSSTTLKTDKNSPEQAKQLELLKNPEVLKYITEKTGHLVSKVMFFMIPFMGLMLKLLFLKRRDLYFTDHVIFSLHLHSFYFSVYVLTELLPLGLVSILFNILVLLVIAWYFIFALRNVYKVETATAIGYAIIIGAVYVIILGTVMAFYTKWIIDAMPVKV